MVNNFNVSSFLDQLRQKPAVRSEKQSNDRIDKIYLSFPDNFGKYQIFPMPSEVTGLPFTSLPNTREIRLPRIIKTDGTETRYDNWIKILPASAYIMNDESGRGVVSSLTRDDETLLTQAQQLFDTLYDKLGGNDRENNNDPELNKTIGFMRRRNYTVFHAKCLSKWNLKDPRTPEKTNFSGLFVCTASGFMQALEDNINDCRISHGGSDEWLNQVYNRKLTDREGYLIISIAMGVNGKVGYQITTMHESDKGNYLRDFTIAQEEEAMMKDPVADFLGWQARYNDPVHLFNRELMRENLDTLARLNAAVDMARPTGANLKEVVTQTIESILSSRQVLAGGGGEVSSPTIPSPYGAPQPAATPVVTNPFGTTPAPAAQLDPVQGAGYIQPSFGSGKPNPFNN